MTHQVTRALRRSVVFACLIALASVLSCGSDPTGPGGGSARRVSQGIGFDAQFPAEVAALGAVAAQVVPFDRVVVEIRRADGTIALTRVVSFGPGEDAVPVTLEIPLSAGAPAGGEVVSVRLAYVNAQGDTVFRGGPVPVTAVPVALGGGAPPPAAVEIQLSYTGPGAEAVTVRAVPRTLSVRAGESFSIGGEALSAAGQVLAGTPLVFEALDAGVTLLGPTAGAGTAGAARGTARVQVRTLTGLADTTAVTITPRPGALTLVAGGGQSAPVSTALPQPVVAQLLATDGLPLAGATVSAAVTAGGGSLSTSVGTTDADGRVSFAWTLGASAGLQRVALSSEGVAALTVEATGIARPLATQLAFTLAPPSTLTAGASGAVVLVEARDSTGALVAEFADSVSLQVSAGPDGGAVLGVTRVAAVNGVASFDAWRIERAGTYTLVATAGALLPATSPQLQVSAAVPTALTVLRGDGQSAVAGTAVSDTVVLRLADAFGNGVPGAELGVAVQAGGGTLAAATVATDLLGVARLPQWTLGLTVGAQSLTVTGPGGLQVVVAATATASPVTDQAIAIAQQPASAQVAGVVVGPALIATVTLPGGAVDTLFTDTLSLALVSGPGETSIVGTTRVAADRGVAVFEAWHVERAGTGFTVAVSGTGLVSATSAPFTVAAAEAASLTVLSGAGQSALAGTALPVLIQVLVRDAFLNPRVGDTVWVALGDSEEGSLAGAYAVTGADGVATLPQWTLGLGVGVQRIEVTVAGAELDPVEIAATATEPTTATQLVITQAPGAAQVAGVVLAPALVVQVRDGEGVLDASFTDSVTVSLAAGPAAGQLTGRTRVAAVAGVATFDSLLIRRAGVGYRLAVTAGALAPDTTTTFTIVAAAPDTLVLVSGGGQTAIAGDTVPLPIVVRAADAYGNPAVGVTVTFAVATGGGTLTGATVATDTLGVARLGRWQLGPTAGTQSITATVSGVAAVTVSATATPPPPVIELSVVGSNVVGFERAGTLQVRLLQPAPVGGVTVSVISDSTQRLTVAPPGTVAFTAGQTIGTIAVSGVAVGPAVVRAEAVGYVSDTLVVPVSLNLLSTPTTVPVPLAQTRSLPITLSTAAPAGGVWVRAESNAPATVRVLTDSVFVAAGSSVVSATVEGLVIGTATLTVTNPNYAPFSSVVTVGAELDIVQSSVGLNASFGSPITVQLRFAGSTIGAPVGGVPITFTSANPACVAAPAPRTIPGGESSVTDTLRYGGTANLSCSAWVRVNGPEGFVVDSVLASVAVPPAISVSAVQVGSGLMRSTSMSLGASNHGGTTVTVRSVDPSKVRLSRTTAEVGDSVITITMAPSTASASYVVHAMEGITADTIGVTVQATGFLTATQSIRVWRPVIDLQNVPTTATTLTPDRAIYAQIGTPFTPTGDFVNSYDAVRRGSPGLSVSFISDAVTVLGLQSTATGPVDSLALLIPQGVAFTPTSVAAGGVALRYVGQGTGVVRLSSPDARVITPSARTVTVSAPALTFGGMNVGSGLQRSASVSLGAPAPTGGLALRITANTLGVVLFAPTASTVGTDTLVVTVPAGQTSASFVVQALEGITADTIQLLATAPGFTAGSGPIRVFQAVQEFYNWTTTATSLTADRVIYASVGTPSNQAGTFINTSDAVRFGGPGMTVSFISDSTAVGTLVTSAGVADSVARVIAPGASNTPTTVASGGVAYRYLNEGVGRVRTVIPGVRALAGANRSVTVTAPVVAPSVVTVASGLQRSGTVSLGAPAPTGGVSVTLKAAAAGRILLAPNASTVGSADSLVVTIAAGSTSASYVVQALDGIIADTVFIVSTAQGFRTDSAPVRIWRAVHEFSGLGTSYNTLSTDVAFRVFVGTPGSPSSGFVSSYDSRRVGADPLIITIASSVPTVGQLRTTARTGDTVTVQVVAGTNGSPATVAAGGVAFDPLSTGTTQVRAFAPGLRPVSDSIRTVNVVPPVINLNAISTVGAGLSTAASGSLSANQHGGVNVIIKSTNPGVARVAPNASTVATDSIIVSLANGVSSFNYVVSGMEGATGSPQISVRAAGFVDSARTVQVVPPALELQSVPSSASVTSSQTMIYPRLGIPNASNTFLTSNQNVRAGSPGILVTVTSSNPGLAQLVTSGATGDTVTVLIPAGNSAPPTSVAAGGLGLRFLLPGTTVLRATAPGTIPIPQPEPGRTLTINP